MAHESRSTQPLAPDGSIVPNHVAIIMDGNGRWAEKRRLPRIEGHQAGVENIRPILEAISKKQVKYLTLFAFSTENWSRPHQEVSGIMNLLREVILKETKFLHKQGVRIIHLGRTENLTSDLAEAIKSAESLTQENEGIILSVAFNYGSRYEILYAIKRMINDGISVDSIDEHLFASYLHTHNLPDPDLIIRTAGEQRLSNFLLWQSAYSELFFTPILWPDFLPGDLDLAFSAYNNRNRRFGTIESES